MRYIQPLTFTLFLLVMQVVGSSVYGQMRPPFQTLRFEEDHSFLKDTSIIAKPLDKLKNIEIGSSGLLSLGGEINQTFEYVRTPFADQTEDAYWLSRLMVHGNLELGRGFRFFGELGSGTISGRRNGPRVIDRDDLYVLNLFGEYRGNQWNVRVGRQELTYGGENLISIRNGTNVRYTFDAAKVWWEQSSWRVDAFAGTFVNTNPGFFDNPVLDTDGDILWGLYAAFRPGKGLPQIEPYYIGLRDPLAFYTQYVGAETRHSFGLRIFDSEGPLTYTLAGVYQAGSSGPFSVSAYQLAAILGYQLPSLPVQVSWNGYLSSGDNNPEDEQLNSFNPYFPQQASFRGAMATRIFPMNILFTGPRLDLNLFPFLLTLDAGFLWRHRTTEGLFIPGGFPAYQAEQKTDKFLGNQVGFTAVQVINRHLTLVVIYSHFTARDYFLEQRNPGQVNDFFIGKMIFKF